MRKPGIPRCAHIFIAILLCSSPTFGLDLKPSIGLSAPPDTSTTICTTWIVPAGNSFEKSGIKVGDIIPDFTLYDRDGNAVNASTVLKTGKPALLVAGSYTCPSFRAQVNKINELYSTYNKKVAIYIVYCLEAHPIVDNSPYSGSVLVTDENYRDSVLYRQPKTYGERQRIVGEMLSRMSILPKVILDGPCNPWWQTFGPAPNNAYLIDTNGRVYSKQGWFGSTSRDMGADIDSLLKGALPADAASANHGWFKVTTIVDTCQATVGKSLVDSARVSNPSPYPVSVSIIRRQKKIPTGWSSAMCTDVCYGPGVDSILQDIGPGESIVITLDFTTTGIPGTATAMIDFSNADSAANGSSLTFVAQTFPVLSLKPSIGLSVAPSTSALICPISLISTSFNDVGPNVSDTIPDFTLYTVDGKPVNAAAVLEKHKPILLVAGSYSSPEFRSHLPALNSIQTSRGNDVAIYIVYVAEAHPIIDNSPYSGTVWVPAQNYADSALCRQARTYGERQSTAAAMRDRISIRPTVILDGPCNAWWTTFGPAPNNAYLIDLAGRVYAKHGQFDDPPLDMLADIDSLLAGAPPRNESQGGPGNGTRGIVAFTADADTVRGDAWTSFSTGGLLSNPSPNPVAIRITRRVNALPPGWTSSLGTDTWYPATKDVVYVYLPAHQTAHFDLDLSTSEMPGKGTVTIEFTNADSVANTWSHTYHVVTSVKNVHLKPSIGLDGAPSPADPICAITPGQVPAPSVIPGPAVGDTIPDFTLYALDGTPVNASAVVARRKPTLLVAGSYTCPEFRARVAALNELSASFGKRISMYIVYVAEPHPIVDTSPYSPGAPWVTSQNYLDTVLYRQPTTYAERQHLVSDMLARMSIGPQVILDGPCNAWWMTYGPAPNNAYLIDTVGRVYAKHAWFDRTPRDMEADLDSLFKGVPAGYASRSTTPSAHGIVAFTADADTVTGIAGTVFPARGRLSNPSSTPAVVRIRRTMSVTPPDWSSAMSTNVALGPTVDTTSVYLAAGDSVPFTLDFSTPATPGAGRVTIEFTNADSVENTITNTFYAVTIAAPTAVAENASTISPVVLAFPQPVRRGQLVTLTAHDASSWRCTICDLLGRVCYSAPIAFTGRTTIPTDNLQSGIYHYMLQGVLGHTRSGTIVVQ